MQKNIVPPEFRWIRRTCDRYI